MTPELKKAMQDAREETNERPVDTGGGTAYMKRLIVAERSATDALISALEERVKFLEVSISDALEYMYQNPAGCIEDADPDDLSPEDMSAHVIGLAAHILRQSIGDKRDA